MVKYLTQGGIDVTSTIKPIWTWMITRLIELDKELENRTGIFDKFGKGLVELGEILDTNKLLGEKEALQKAKQIIEENVIKVE